VGGIDTYTVTVNATVGAGVIGTPAGVCPAPGSSANGAFNNEAGLTVNGVITNEEACAEPSAPTIKKTFVNAVQNPTNPSEWEVSYLLTVSGNEAPGSPMTSPSNFFTLTDTPRFSPGVTVSGATVNGTAVPFTPPTLTVVGTPTEIGAGATLEFAVTIAVSINHLAPGFSPDCTGAPGHGFFNEGTLTSGKDDVTAEDCGNIPPVVNPTVTKTVTSTVQNPNGTWTVIYDVVVTQPARGGLNPEGLSGVYSLSDTLRFGAGINIHSAAWTGATTGSWPNPVTNPTAILATDRVILAGSIDIYTVTVNASVTRAAFDNRTNECSTATPPTASGFLNIATLTASETKTEVHACSDPAVLTVTKTAATPTFDPVSGHWTIVYTIVVNNTSSLAQFFDLADAPAFPAGVTIISATATGPGSPDHFLDRTAHPAHSQLERHDQHHPGDGDAAPGPRVPHLYSHGGGQRDGGDDQHPGPLRQSACPWSRFLQPGHAHPRPR
jgi:hypothetical protein